MAKKKNVPPPPEEDDVPEGTVDEEGDEILNLDDVKDDLDDDLDYDLNKIEDEMLADETEDEEFGPEVEEIIKMLRGVKCAPCPGSKHVTECQVRHDYGCPPEKAEKFVPLTESQRRKKVKK